MDENFWEESPFEDEFLFDQDLLQEGLLSQEDAWTMYHRGEINKRQLLNYIEFLDNSYQIPDSTPEVKKPDPVLTILFVIVFWVVMIACALLYAF